MAVLGLELGPDVRDVTVVQGWENLLEFPLIEDPFVVNIVRLEKLDEVHDVGHLLPDKHRASVPDVRWLELAVTPLERPPVDGGVIISKVLVLPLAVWMLLVIALVLPVASLPGSRLAGVLSLAGRLAVPTCGRLRCVNLEASGAT